ncbi:MAG TPA: hypothetical protein P5169_02165 [Kiritimatiellia bacterium]|jgi:DNA-binding XRE family transcriptional regulator|nr:hypothetical protein [Lentisphaerota bacterium]HRV30486.1 hypothetical protein [Kiritimatiellia bacterium]
MKKYTQEELAGAIRAISSLASKCEKVRKKFAAGTSQHTLLKNRVRALRISLALLKNEKAKSCETGDS